jgi:glyoxylase-like metal-dependent hydrolase (beta-lactamase superfamily II)
VTAPDWLEVIERPFPSAVMVVVKGPRPIVVDPGSLTDADQLPQLLCDVDRDVATVVCSHYHSDHVGAVATLQEQGARVCAHGWDAAMVNARDPQVCASRWLDQPVLPYRVDTALEDGDVITTGDVALHVLHTPGHTLGALSLWEPDSRTLICGDAIHEHDSPWIGAPHEGAGSLQRAMLTLDRIERLDPALVISGHGAPITDIPSALASNRRRFAQWAENPEAGVLYAAKRIFTYRLMLEPIASDQALQTLRNAPWIRDLAASIDHDRDQLAQELFEALAPALTTEDGLLRTTAPHRRSPIPVPWHYIDTRTWD